jgi:hypothetical protein
LTVPYVCIARVQSNNKSNDYIRYRYPENVTALPSPLLIKKYNVITSSLPKKVTVTVTALQVTHALLPNPVQLLMIATMEIVDFVCAICKNIASNKDCLMFHYLLPIYTQLRDP